MDANGITPQNKIDSETESLLTHCSDLYKRSRDAQERARVSSERWRKIREQNRQFLLLIGEYCDISRH